MKAYLIILLLICLTVISCNDRPAGGVDQDQPLLEGQELRQTDDHLRDGRQRPVEEDRYISERGGTLSAERVRTAEQRIRELKARHADMMQEHRRLMDEHRAFLQLDRSQIGDEEWHRRMREIEGQQNRMEQEFQQMMEEHELMRSEHLRIDEERRVGN